MKAGKKREWNQRGICSKLKASTSCYYSIPLYHQELCWKTEARCREEVPASESHFQGRSKGLSSNFQGDTAMGVRGYISKLALQIQTTTISIKIPVSRDETSTKEACVRRMTWHHGDERRDNSTRYFQ